MSKKKTGPQKAKSFNVRAAVPQILPSVGGEDEDLINPADFESMKLEFNVSNTTTSTSVKDRSAVRMIELRDDGFVLEMPRGSCAKGHSLLIEILITLPRKVQGVFSTTAKAESVEKDAEGMDRIELALVQYDEREWLKFVDLFNRRQQEIQQFLSAVRGIA